MGRARSARELKPGDTIPAGAAIDATVPSARDRIVVALFTGRVETQTTSFAVPARVEPGLVSRVWRAIVGNYRPTYVPTLWRGPELTDGVARVGPGATVDLSAWHSDERIGRRLELRRVDPTGQLHPERAAAFTLSPDPAEWKSVQVEGVEPGLWQLAIGRAGASGTGTDQRPCCVLLVAADRFEDVDRADREAIALTGTWPDDVPAEAVRAFLRTYLLSLAPGSGDGR
jgi:hypothetical protein